MKNLYRNIILTVAIIVGIVSAILGIAGIRDAVSEIWYSPFVAKIVTMLVAIFYGFIIFCIIASLYFVPKQVKKRINTTKNK